jgi:hypothetical protein
MTSPYPKPVLLALPGLLLSPPRFANSIGPFLIHNDYHPGTGRMAKLLGARAPVLVSPMTSLPSGSSIPLGLDSNSQRGAAYTGGG